MVKPITLPEPGVRETEASHGGAWFPPVDGHGGDDWQNQPQGRRGPRDRLRRYRLGMAFALFSIGIFFVALTTAYLLRQAGSRIDHHTQQVVSDWKPVAVPSILWLNTLLLLFSSCTMEAARRNAFREPAATEAWLGLEGPRRTSLLLLAVTTILGAGFLFGQMLAWLELQTLGTFASSNPSGSFFLLLTGSHAVHLVGGLFALLWATFANLRHLSIQTRQITVDVTSWYWHAMGVLWIYIFTLLKFFA